MNNKFKFPVNDVAQCIINEQRTISGTSVDVSVEGTNLTNFITSVIGTNVTIKDRNDVVIVVFPSSMALHTPLRIDGGFKMTASATAYVTFGTLIGSM